MTQHKFPIPPGPTDSTMFKTTTGWDLYVRDGLLVIAGDCTRDEADMALSDNIAAATAAEAERIAAEEAKAAAKASAIAKLAALGLTEDEAAALIGA